MKKAEAEKLLKLYVQSPSLLNHCTAVSVSMKYYADIYNEDRELWEITGILHDLDYEKYPDIHPDKSVEILKEMNEDVRLIHAINSHRYNDQIESLLDKVLFACDEISGFVVACTLVRPNKSIEGMKVHSVVKKLKDKAFAKNVSREDIKKGAELLNLSLEEHIGNIISALSKEKVKLGI